MPHVTFVHGLANKPPADKLHQIWLRALQRGGLDLEDEGVSSAMVYYGDVLYENPLEDETAEESREERKAEQVDGGGDAETPVPENEAEAAFLRGFRAELTGLSDQQIESGAADAVAMVAATQLERVPLPWFIKKRIMKALLRDAYLFLFNKDYSPRAGATFKVQDVLRQRFLEALAAAPAGGKHVVVSHSMGTMVAYDCLKRVDGCPKIDGFITMGSPLGIDEVQDCYKPAWSRQNGYLADKLGAPWVNFYDPLDVVCGADPCLANDFQEANKPRIEEFAVINEGAWRHSAVKYLQRRELREVLQRLLGI
jgi:pimeloyl-ACP methyl ester carboxylesterase